MANIATITTPDGITHNIKDANAIHSSEKGVANGVASLGTDGKVPSSQLNVLDAAAVEDYVEQITLLYRGSAISDAQATDMIDDIWVGE